MVETAVFGAALGTGTALLIAMTIVVYKYYNLKRKSKEWHSLDKMPLPPILDKYTTPFYPLLKTVVGLMASMINYLADLSGTPGIQNIQRGSEEMNLERNHPISRLLKS